MASSATVLVSSELVLHPDAVESTATAQQVIAPRQLPPQDDEERRCRACQSPAALYTDWAQGDRVCTACGVVDDNQLLDDSPEWKDFNEADDLAKGGPSLARSGLVPNDESKYLGGLQPTTLSRYIVGGSTANSSSSIRKQLIIARHRMDMRIEKMQRRELRAARVRRLLIEKQRKQGRAVDDVASSTLMRPPLEEMVSRRRSKTTNPTKSSSDHTILRPEVEEMTSHQDNMKDKDDERIEVALYADKWSLQRAIRLYGSEHEQNIGIGEQEEDVEELRKELGATLRQSAQDMYTAYSMLMAAAHNLNLPDRVTQETTTMLCRYATKRDGLKVRGVSSTLQRKKRPAAAPRSNPRVEKVAKEALREYNKTKQMGALCAALLFYMARKMKYPRSLVEVCDSIEPTSSVASNPHLDLGKEAFIKKKHCSKAMSEIKESFPDFAKAIASIDGITAMRVRKETASSSPNAAICNFVEHVLRKLHLPPVAEASVGFLALHWYKQERQAEDKNSGQKKLSLVCGALAYFVCLAGSTMQNLAAQSSNIHVRSRSAKHISAPATKRIKLEELTEPASSRKTSSGDMKPVDKVLEGEFASEQRAYEMHRMWDAWSEQRSWSRTLVDVENDCGLSQRRVIDFYQTQLHPKRQSLLALLQGTVCDGTKDTGEMGVSESRRLRETPLASILLSHVTSAAPLMKADVK